MRTAKGGMLLIAVGACAFVLTSLGGPCGPGTNTGFAIMALGCFVILIGAGMLVAGLVGDAMFPRQYPMPRKRRNVQKLPPG